MNIEFTQFFLPNGRREQVTTEVSDDLRDKVDQILENGFRFEIEVLRTGHVSATINDPIGERDAAFSITTNGPEVQAGIEKMIREFNIVDAMGFRDPNNAL